jgi:RND family efflux transporter MFP subunit
MDIRTLQEQFFAMNKKSAAGLVVIVAFALFGTASLLIGGEKGHATVPAPESALKAPVAIAESAAVEDVITAAGALVSRNTSVLSSKIMGKVVALNVHEGDHVAEGSLLLRIESGEITAQVIQAQAAYNNAKLQYDRIKSLFDAKASTQMEMDQVVLGLQTAEAGLKAARAMESYTIITAPIAGQIVEKKINLGEMAMPGQPVLKIEDNRHLRLEVTVRESDLPHIQAGKAVTVQIDALPGRELRGRVAQVVPAADVRTHSFLVKIDIAAEKGLITGMYGKTFFSKGRRRAIVVPRSAVVEMGGISGVYVVGPENKARFQMVQPGGAQGGSVEIVTGLAAGDRVVADNTLGRIEGRTIEAREK